MMALFERATFWVADISIATNESYRRVAIEGGGMDPDRVFVVRSGPNLARVLEMPPNPVWRRCRRHLVAYVGVIGQQEGIELLLGAVCHVVKKLGRRDIHFVVVGKGPALDPMRDLAARSGLADYITFTGARGRRNLIHNPVHSRRLRQPG
jgi:glycosyltransferase involved in cell wall biosynthesis